MKFDALIGVFEYALASGLDELLQTQTVHVQICRLADGLSGFCFEHGLQTGDQPVSGCDIASDPDSAVVERLSGKPVTDHGQILTGAEEFERADRFQLDFNAVDLRKADFNDGGFPFLVFPGIQAYLPGQRR